MKPMMTIRRAELADIDAVTSVFMEYLAFQSQTHTRQVAQEFLHARLTQNQSVIYIAENGGVLVGMAQVYPVFSSVSLAPAWILNDLYVTESARGIGAGRALLQEVLDQAKVVGAAYVTLETGDDNVRAQQLYESEGFTLDPETRNYTKITKHKLSA